MTFTPAQTTALEALELAFGPTKMEVGQVHRGSVAHYPRWVEIQIEAALGNYAAHKLASTLDFAEQDRLKREADARRRAERAEGVRDSIVIGFLSGLMPKIARTHLGAETTFEVNGNGASLLVDNGADELQVTYYRASKEVYTLIEGVEYTEDVTTVHGSVSPREQLNGFAAVLDYLDKAEAAASAAE